MTLMFKLKADDLKNWRHMKHSVLYLVLPKDNRLHLHLGALEAKYTRTLK